MSKSTPGPWEIDWYVCRMDKDDVQHAKENGNLSAKLGDELWRKPISIGPCQFEHCHWGGYLLNLKEEDARLIAAAPELLDALGEVSQTLAWLANGKCRGFSDGLLTATDALNKARSAIDKATGKQL